MASVARPSRCVTAVDIGCVPVACNRLLCCSCIGHLGFAATAPDGGDATCRLPPFACSCSAHSAGGAQALPGIGAPMRSAAASFALVTSIVLVNIRMIGPRSLCGPAVHQAPAYSVFRPSLRVSSVLCSAASTPNATCWIVGAGPGPADLLTASAPSGRPLISSGLVLALL